MSQFFVHEVLKRVVDVEQSLHLQKLYTALSIVFIRAAKVALLKTLTFMFGTNPFFILKQ